jgi:hypothetical protein
MSISLTNVQAKCRLTFRLFTTFQPAYKALRSNAAGWNVGEEGVGA